MCNLKYNTNELIYKTEIRPTDLDKKLMVIRGERGRGIHWDIGIDVYTLLDIEKVNLLSRYYCIAQGTLLNTL